MSFIIDNFTHISYLDINFYIFDAPTSDNVGEYVNVFNKFNISLVIRACTPTFNEKLLKDKNITLIDMSYKDGTCPSDIIIRDYLDLIFKNKDKIIGVYCVAGLGRAPVLVAIGLIEYGMSPLDAISLIRYKRRHCFNDKQINFLYNYKRIYDNGRCCNIL